MKYPRISDRALIVFIVNELAHFQKHREHLAHAAMAMDMRPVLLAAPVGDTSKLTYEYRPIVIERFRLHFSDFRFFLQIFWLLLKERPQVLHLISIKPYLFGGLAARLANLFGWRGGVVMTVPGLGRLYDPTDASLKAHLQRFIVEFFLRIATRGARVTFETDHDRDFWLRRHLVVPRQVMVTPGAGIDLDQFILKQKPTREVKLKVLFAGRLLRSKGLDVFLKAAALINDVDIEMQVAGFIENDPDAFPEDELYANTNICFLGPVTNMPTLLAETDVVILPSRYNEGIPRILIEAAACGCALVATHFAGSEKLIVPGQTGLFLETETVDAQAKELAGLIAELSENRMRCRAFGTKASAHVRENGFSAETVAGTFSGLYAAIKADQRLKEKTYQISS